MVNAFSNANYFDKLYKEFLNALTESSMTKKMFNVDPDQ
jgi:hypothetical protein